MAILEIFKGSNPILRKKSKSVRSVTPEIIKLIKDMEETMRAAPGIGLAAPQVGRSVRVIIADAGERLTILINPKIISKSGSYIYNEGCLSLPGMEAPVERAATVTVKGLDAQGKPVILKAEDLLATVLQHEIDHLDGKLFTDRVKDKDLIKYKVEVPEQELI